MSEAQPFSIETFKRELEYVICGLETEAIPDMQDDETDEEITEIEVASIVQVVVDALRLASDNEAKQVLALFRLALQRRKVISEVLFNAFMDSDDLFRRIDEKLTEDRESDADIETDFGPKE